MIGQVLQGMTAIRSGRSRTVRHRQWRVVCKAVRAQFASPGSPRWRSLIYFFLLFFLLSLSRESLSRHPTCSICSGQAGELCRSGAALRPFSKAQAAWRRRRVNRNRKRALSNQFTHLATGLPRVRARETASGLQRGRKRLQTSAAQSRRAGKIGASAKKRGDARREIGAGGNCGNYGNCGNCRGSAVSAVSATSAPHGRSEARSPVRAAGSRSCPSDGRQTVLVLAGPAPEARPANRLLYAADASTADN